MTEDPESRVACETVVNTGLCLLTGEITTKALEPEPGDMLTDPQKVFSKAEEMAAKYEQMLFEQTDENEEIPVASETV